MSQHVTIIAVLTTFWLMSVVNVKLRGSCTVFQSSICAWGAWGNMGEPVRPRITLQATSAEVNTHERHCDLSCGWRHNPASSPASPHPEGTPSMTPPLTFNAPRMITPYITMQAHATTRSGTPWCWAPAPPKHGLPSSEGPSSESKESMT